MNSVVTMADASSKHGNATMKMTVGTVVMRKVAFIHLVHQENSPALIIAVSHNLKCATVLMIVKTTLLRTRHMSDVLVTLHAR